MEKVCLLFLSSFLWLLLLLLLARASSLGLLSSVDLVFVGVGILLLYTYGEKIGDKSLRGQMDKKNYAALQRNTWYKTHCYKDWYTLLRRDKSASLLRNIFFVFSFSLFLTVNKHG